MTIVKSTGSCFLCYGLLMKMITVHSHIFIRHRCMRQGLDQYPVVTNLRSVNKYIWLQPVHNDPPKKMVVHTIVPWRWSTIVSIWRLAFNQNQNKTSCIQYGQDCQPPVIQADQTSTHWIPLPLTYPASVHLNIHCAVPVLKVRYREVAYNIRYANLQGIVGNT